VRPPGRWSSGVGNLDVHYLSGIANHFAYLLAEGSGANTIGGLPHTRRPVRRGQDRAGHGRRRLVRGQRELTM
jgi:hypothetical protein